MVFYGEYTVSFTSGGRLVLPKKIRELINGTQFVITKGFDQCLSGFNLLDWQKRAGEFMSTSLVNTQDLELKRVIFSGAVYVELDDQGRFVLPKNLLDYLQLNQRVVFTGVGDHFEIWGENRWLKYLKMASIKTNLATNNE